MEVGEVLLIGNIVTETTIAAHHDVFRCINLFLFLILGGLNFQDPNESYVFIELEGPSLLVIQLNQALDPFLLRQGPTKPFINMGDAHSENISALLCKFVVEGVCFILFNLLISQFTVVLVNKGFAERLVWLLLTLFS